MAFDNGQTPLFVAIHSGFIDAANALIEAGANVHATLKPSEVGMLTIAICTKNLQLVQRLIAAGVDVNAKDKNGNRTPLHYAYETKAPLQIIRALEHAGADKNALDEEGRKPDEMS
jgi:ankyrin repeat protein